ncbi:FecR domain-containing protein, partial [Akkermansiaceae bacterium]|nr:FecR domain-containing protein [Akkermansiaceae bacterium]
MNKTLEALIADYVAGEPVDDEILAACRENPEVLAHVVKHIAIERLIHSHSLHNDEDTFAAEVILRLEAQEDENFSNKIREQLENAEHKEIKKKSKITPFISLSALAACIVISLTIYFNTFDNHPKLAIITASVDAVWEGAEKAVNDSIGEGTIELSYGYSEIKMNNGVALLLEAPVKINVESLDLVRLLSGRMVVKVPEQAIGFTVLTPSSEIIDLGTEFGMNVDESGASEVHVLDGEVKARPLKEKEFNHLAVNEAMAFKESQPSSRMASSPEAFLRTLPGRSPENPEYLHWSCDETSSNTLVCEGTGIDGELFPGTLKSLKGGELPTFGNGQFGQGIYFNGINNYVDTNFSGIEGNNPRTVAFWTKVPAASDAISAYGMLGWGRMSPSAAWQISSNPNEKEGPLGRLRVGTHSAYVIGTTDLRDNRWHHVAVVLYGGEYADVSTHILIYIDGKLEKTSRKSIA